MPFRPLAFFLLLLAAVPVWAQPQVLAPTGKWVTDRGDFLAPAEEERLTAKLRTYADTTSTQIVIVTLRDLGGAEAADYATELGRRWEVGQQGQNNGVVILVSRDDRQLFIATGYGLEGAIPDAIAARIYRNVLVPAFREGRFYEGLDRAVDALVAAATGEFTADDAPEDGGGGGDIVPLIILLILIFVFVNAARHGGGGGGGKRYRSSRSGMPPVILWGGGGGFGGGSGGFGGGGFGGFGGGGGSFGGGGAGGGW